MTSGCRYLTGFLLDVQISDLDAFDFRVEIDSVFRNQNRLLAGLNAALRRTGGKKIYRRTFAPHRSPKNEIPLPETGPSEQIALWEQWDTGPRQQSCLHAQRLADSDRRPHSQVAKFLQNDSYRTQEFLLPARRCY